VSLVFDPPPQVLAPVSDGRRYPVRRIFCIGRNYAAHAREMGKDPDREAPFYFTKWAQAVVPSGSIVAYPPQTANLHFEGELVVAIGKAGRNIDPDEAAAHVFGYATGLDLTRRDLQDEAKRLARPWSASKNFEQASPLGLIHPASDVGQIATGAIRTLVNGEVKQSGDLGDMIWPAANVIASISRGYRIEPGDLIYTGTPAGVGAIVEGDEIVVQIEGLSDTVVRIGPPEAD
jgi:fumarylpyruvate hydrolase